ncbi:hypothetical protein ACFV0L_04635 [Streptosporangium canum]|uniref:hypothetical protein n=1 Tax=Streptosporangium canum TaxID=324952 RepID=UPI0036CC96E4
MKIITIYADDTPEQVSKCRDLAVFAGFRTSACPQLLKEAHGWTRRGLAGLGAALGPEPGTSTVVHGAVSGAPAIPESKDNHA